VVGSSESIYILKGSSRMGNYSDSLIILDPEYLGRVYIKNVNSGKFLSVMRNYSQTLDWVKENKETERFELINYRSLAFCIKNFYGKYISSPDAENFTLTDECGANETFLLVNNTPSVPVYVDQWVFLVNSYHNLTLGVNPKSEMGYTTRKRESWERFKIEQYSHLMYRLKHQ